MIQFFDVSTFENRNSILTNGLIHWVKLSGCGNNLDQGIFVATVYEEAGFDYIT
ncbi:MAG: hypothetical protein WKG06_01710 [Segetibacter sp.]